MSHEVALKGTFRTYSVRKVPFSATPGYPQRRLIHSHECFTCAPLPAAVNVSFVAEPADFHDVAPAASNLVLTRKELAVLGVTERMIWARVRAGGPWQRLHPGVIMLRNGTPTPPQSIDAALRYAGPNAILTGISACGLYGMQRLPTAEDVHVLIPHRNRRLSVDGVLVERTTRIPPTTSRAGFPVASLTRAVLDAARRLRGREQVEALLAQAVQRGMTTPRRLRAELDEGSVRGSALPRAVLASLERGAQSPAEVWGVQLAARSGLPEPQWNARLFTSAGVALAKTDAWFDEVAMAWEIDSYDWHLSPADYARTLRRHAILTAAGVIVLHTLPSRLRTEPKAVIAELRAAYHQASQRPRPDIVAR